MIDNVIKKLDELISTLSEMYGSNNWSIHLRSEVAKELFGFPIPETYKGNDIIVNDDLKETILKNEEWSSDILVLKEVER